jgi:uncharacterized membrane protein
MLIDVQAVAEGLRGLPPQLATTLIAMAPVIELRGAIPAAIMFYKMHWASAYFWSVLGNIVPAVFFIFALEGISGFIMKHSSLGKRFFDWLFDRTRRKVDKKMKKYGRWGLFFLVAIPLPVTGGWTGALAAFLFGIKKQYSAMIISLGIATAGVIVVLLTIWGDLLWKFLTG